MTSATAAVMPNELKRPTSAAASAGRMSSVSGEMSSVVSGAIITPANAASMQPSAQFAAPIRSGERPSSDAPRSLSATARVAMPNVVNR